MRDISESAASLGAALSNDLLKIFVSPNFRRRIVLLIYLNDSNASKSSVAK